MKNIIFSILLITLIISCKNNSTKSDVDIVLLHHSTGDIIWHGKEIPLFTKIVRKISPKLAKLASSKAKLPKLINEYSLHNEKTYHIDALRYPVNSGNNPYNYYDNWVKNDQNTSTSNNLSLDELTKRYNVIIFKHCFSAAHIKEDKVESDINSSYKSISNYKHQYNALKQKLNSYPNTKFILFTGAAEVKSQINEAQAQRANSFFTWVKNEWDTHDDNIFIWDLYGLQTEGGIYLKEEFAQSSDDSHPNASFANDACNLLCKRIIDVIDNNGKNTATNGQPIHKQTKATL